MAVRFERAASAIVWAIVMYRLWEVAWESSVKAERMTPWLSGRISKAQAGKIRQVLTRPDYGHVDASWVRCHYAVLDVVVVIYHAATIEPIPRVLGNGDEVLSILGGTPVG